MADRIKGLKIVLGADASELTSAIYAVNTAIGKTRTNLREISNALKFDPTNVNLLKDKQTELNLAIEQTEDKIQKEKEALQNLKDAGVDETSQQFRDLKVQIDLDESALQNLNTQAKNFGSVGVQVAKAVGDKMKEVGEKVKAVGDKIAEVGTGITTTLTVPIVAAGTKAVASFAEVDKTMQLTNKIMGNSVEEATMLNEAMEKAASNSVFGMTDAATATLNFARAGLTAEEAAAALAPAMNLAAGEAGDLDTVSAGLTATINGFGDSFGEAEHYADVFAAACNNSALDVDSLSEAMSIAAPIFATAGKEVEDAALFMGVMANAGIDANVAANSLKTGMARLAEPTKQAKEAMEEYGIAMSDVWNEDGSMKDSVTIQKNLHDAFADLTEQEQMSAAGAIFGKNQMASWLALINTAPEDVNALSESIMNSTGTTNEMSQAMMEGFGGSIEKLKSSLDVLMTSLGRIIAEYLTPVIEKIQGVVDKFMALDEETKQHIVKIAAVVAAIGPVLIIVGKVVAAIGTVISVVGTITSAIATIAPIVSGIGAALAAVIPAIAAVAAPVLAVVAAIAAVIAIIVTCIKHWDQIKEVASNVADVLAKKWEQFKSKMASIWNSIVSNVANLISNMKNNAVNVFTSMQSSISNTIGNIRNTIVNGFQNAIGYITSLPSQARGWGRDIINGVVDGIYSAFSNLINAVSNIAGTIASYIHFSEPDVGPLRNFHTFMPDMMTQLARGIENGIPSIESAMDAMTRSMVPTMGNAAGNATTSNTSNTVNVNVYGAQGQDVNELARIIENKITDNVVRRGVAFA